MDGVRKADTAGANAAGDNVVGKVRQQTENTNQASTDATPADDLSQHRVLYQEGVDLTVGTNGATTTRRNALYGVAGLRFSVNRLEVDRRVTLSATVIRIEDSRGELLIPDKNSAVPVYMAMNNAGNPQVSFFYTCHQRHVAIQQGRHETQLRRKRLPS